MRRLATLLAALALVACGDDRSPAQKALDRAEDGLAKIRSGALAMQLLASASAAPSDRGVGFRLEGPFRVGRDEGDLPVADLEYTRITDTGRRTTEFLSTGTAAFVRLDGVYHELGDDQVEELRVRDGAEGQGLEGLSLGAWMEKPQVSTGPRIGGVATRRLSGTVDPVPAINDLLELAEGFGAGEDSPGPLEGDGAEAVRRAVRAARAVLWVGAEDDLLRRMDLTIDLRVGDDSAAVRRALGGLAGARLSFRLDVNGVNEPVTVEAPAGARPAP